MLLLAPPPLQKISEATLLGDMLIDGVDIFGVANERVFGTESFPDGDVTSIVA